MTLKESVTKYWTKHTVTNNHNFISVEESLNWLDWRNKQYLYYSEYMPTNNANDLVVLDYGCGPGYDTVGFLINSSPKKLVACDVSRTALQQAKNRIMLHGKNANLLT